MKLDSKVPEGAIGEKWEKYKGDIKLVNPANKRKLDVIVVGTGLAGAAAAASLGEVAAVSFFYSERLVPLPLLISRWMAQYRFDDAQALAGVLLLLSLATVVFFSRSLSGVRLRPI
jgi:ABC-type Fe3+ transport system permease subunit